mmetsp:Transcript_78400/g.136942  ORF Transcript_78400/g.136942 Transcript_78400/m.136942 type:complete len:212 (-) Transcript_78400:104-739(-)
MLVMLALTSAGASSASEAARVCASVSITSPAGSEQEGVTGNSASSRSGVVCRLNPVVLLRANSCFEGDLLEGVSCVLRLETFLRKSMAAAIVGSCSASAARHSSSPSTISSQRVPKTSGIILANACIACQVRAGKHSASGVSSLADAVPSAVVAASLPLSSSCRCTSEIWPRRRPSSMQKWSAAIWRCRSKKPANKKEMSSCVTAATKRSI